MQKGLFDENVAKDLEKLESINLEKLNKKIIESSDDVFEESSESDLDKILKSNKLSIQDRINLIRRNVLRVLGKYKNNVICIKSRQELHDYISQAIIVKRIAIDTETNNSLDPVTCKIAGLCLYYPGGKQAYIPINHRNPDTKERLSWQCTEQDIKEELQRIKENNIPEIYHNGKFDYEVIYCTSGIKMKPAWDTMTFYRL